LRLATTGQLDLDAPVLKYLPDLFPGKAPVDFAEVSVRHLLDHTAGLNDANLWQMFSERADPNGPLSDAFTDPASQLQLRSRPGSRFSYSNMGYALLGMIIEAVVGERYETYLDTHVLLPLAMHDSTFAFTTQAGETADPRLAWGHVDDGSRYAASPIFLRPAGQFTTTTTDLASFAKFLLSDGIVDGRPFIDGSLMRSRGIPEGTEAANEGLVAGYALGLGRRDRHGVIGYCHGGNIVGFVALLCIFPTEQKAFAYSVNTDSETATYDRLAGRLIDALGIAKARPPESVHLASDASDWHGRYVLSPNRFQSFEYLDTLFGSVRVSADGAFLNLSSLQRGTRQLRPVGKYLFSASDRSTTSHVLYRGRNGEFLLGDGFVTYERSSSIYLIAHWASVLLGLAGLVWIVVSGGLALIRHRRQFLRQPVAPAFVASVLLLVPVPLFLTQSFMALGDATFASVTLAAVTLLLPLGMLLTVILAAGKCRSERQELLNGTAAALTLQWCGVLAAAGILPLRLWA
jgi:CubicO group peptidase (beta-lactamase class C family)